MKYLSYEGLQYLYGKILTRLGLKVDVNGGDISETVIEALDTVEDKYPVPAAGESVKRFFGKVLMFLRNIRPLTGDINIYVSTTGSDILGDGSELNPFKTIQHAIDIIPKDLNGHTVTVWVADGTYDESITISGFKTGKFILRTFRSSTLSSLTKLADITCVYNTAYIQIDGFEITTVSNDGILCNHCTDVRLSFMKIIAVASTYKAIYGAEVNLFRVWNCELSNKKYAVYAANAYGYVNECIGTSNNIGIYAYSASTIHMAGNSISATTPLLSDWGSMFVNQNGTQISDDITARLSCTWGTIRSGYVRHGNLVGAAMISINVRIDPTVALTAGTTYKINGFPPPAIQNYATVAVCVDGASRTTACSLDTTGAINFVPSINVPIGTWGFTMSATYKTNS